MQLCAQNLGVTFVSLADAQSHVLDHSRIISLVDLESRNLIKSDQANFARVKDLTIPSSSPSLALSSGDPIQASEPESAIMVGWLRTIITELPQARFAHSGFKRDRFHTFFDDDNSYRPPEGAPASTTRTKRLS